MAMHQIRNQGPRRRGVHDRNGRVRYLVPGETKAIDLDPGHVRRIKARRGEIVIVATQQAQRVGRPAQETKAPQTQAPQQPAFGGVQTPDIGAMPVKDAVTIIAVANSREELAALRKSEDGRPGGPRTTVLNRLSRAMRMEG